ncbi:hypothetical protein [Solirubrum puertoriconensis]|uniref:Uncharacterized protein n=1 Tax=Solirubrum puertoriconensis TaxID=1751427 RepID=A0A9X0HLV2_SOLP1|nr:hypothetical protein [Solirubrum puertoriconensis]KUG08334.1 hypothetical protein ASU33_09175 [Solirubrum puertoriconensis]
MSPALQNQPTRRYSPTLVRVAYWVSTLGNPLFTALVFVGVLAFRLLEVRVAAWLMAGMLLGVAAPMSIWNYRQVKTGAYTDFDVSVREHRASFYPRLIVLLGVATALVWATPSAAPLRAGMLAALGLLVACYGINFRLKVSLHAALSFFMAGCVLGLNQAWGLGALLVASLVAASRLVLKRHSLIELVVGTVVGMGAALLAVIIA